MVKQVLFYINLYTLFVPHLFLQYPLCLHVPQSTCTFGSIILSLVQQDQKCLSSSLISETMTSSGGCFLFSIHNLLESISVFQTHLLFKI